MTMAARTPIVLQLVLLVTLSACIPFAMQFTVYEAYCNDTSRRIDPIGAIRTGLIGVGLLSAFATVPLFWWGFIASLRSKSLSAIASNFVSHIGAGMATVAIGWVLFPYWINGIHQAYLGNGPGCVLSAYDPRFFFPMTVLGEAWRLPIIVIVLCGYATVPCLLVAGPIATLKARDTLGALAAGAGLVMLVTIWSFTPQALGTWLVD